MANTATRATMRARVRQQADIVNSTHVTDAEINTWVDIGLSELHDILVSHFEDYLESSSDITTVSGTSDYALPSTFYKLLAADLVEGGTRYSLGRYMHRERNRYQDSVGGIGRYVALFKYRVIGTNLRLVPTPTSARTVNLRFVPTYTELAADATLVNQAIPQGWEELAVMDAATKAALKEESFELAQMLMAQKAAIFSRIMSCVDDRDSNEPAHMVDVSRRFDDSMAWEDS